MNPIDKLFQIWLSEENNRRVEAGGVALTSEEAATEALKFGQVASSITASGEVKADAAELGASGTSMMTFMEDYAKTPEGKKYAADRMRDQDVATFAKEAGAVLNLVLSGVEFNSAKQQIKAGQKAAADLAPPTSPTVPAPNQALREAQDLARTRMYNPTSAPEYGAYISQDMLNQQRALQAAQIASGGQGSQFQAFAQSAQNQANQQALQRMGAIQGIRQGAEQQFGNIAAQRSQEALNIGQQQNQLYNINQNAYLNQLASARATESMGRQNRLTAFSNFANNAPALARVYTGFGGAVDAFANRMRAGAAQARNEAYLQQQQQGFYPDAYGAQGH